MTRRTASPEETEALGEALAAACRGGEVIRLSGDLGAGKTCLSRGIARGLGADPAQVASPTFTLLNIYPGRLPMYHVDLYRIESPAELARLDLFEEVEGPGVTVVEWPDLGGEHTPADALCVSLSHGPGEAERGFAFSLSGNGPEYLLSAIGG
ncbi:MAG: tRNA (adenosine(37)-N6)-threonylcarbamoyltransferase complex ATPase subunit type 1 TsaE [Leptospirillia bacterium]